jgi:hypothetical protein
MHNKLSLSQNSVSFVPSSWKKRLSAVFSIKSRVAVPKTEVLGQPQLITQDTKRKFTTELHRGNTEFHEKKKKIIFVLNSVQLRGEFLQICKLW